MCLFVLSYPLSPIQEYYWPDFKNRGIEERGGFHNRHDTQSAWTFRQLQPGGCGLAILQSYHHYPANLLTWFYRLSQVKPSNSFLPRESIPRPQDLILVSSTGGFTHCATQGDFTIPAEFLITYQKFVGVPFWSSQDSFLLLFIILVELLVAIIHLQRCYPFRRGLIISLVIPSDGV